MLSAFLFFVSLHRVLIDLGQGIVGLRLDEVGIVGELEATETGVFAPPALIGAMPFAGLRALVDEAIAALEALTPAEVNGWAGKALNIALYRPLDEDDRSSAWAPRQLAFTSETFLLSFSLPNFHFHAVTAYDILRSRGVPLGKRDYEGQLRTRSTSPKSDSATHG